LVSFGVQAQHEHQGSIHSQYAGQQHQSIKSLTPEDINGLRSGSGTPFNGMAKPAELNGYPGPRHVLDAHEAGEFELTDDQLNIIQKLFDDMQQTAIPLGEKIITLEKQIDNAFKEKNVTDDSLKELINKSAEIYAELRYTHLKTHLQMVSILTDEQVQHYNELRGYTTNDPCEKIPVGHDAEMWKQHNGCDP
jgi:Spy/CpxP family protein refolding chaperone